MLVELTAAKAGVAVASIANDAAKAATFLIVFIVSFVISPNLPSCLLKDGAKTGIDHYVNLPLPIRALSSGSGRCSSRCGAFDANAPHRTLHLAAPQLGGCGRRGAGGRPKTKLAA